MERQDTVVGDLLLELKEAEQLDVEDTTPLSFTRNQGGILTLICC